jgi:phosphoglycerol transferase MdoB-like AlkP superfamily enzyme
MVQLPFLRNHRRHAVVFVWVAAVVVLGLLVRVSLLLRSAASVDFDATLAGVFAWGFVFDLGTALLSGLPLMVALTVLPAQFFTWKIGRIAASVAGVAACFGLLFAAVAEWLFWDEFAARFNFIAVDYLVYTTEVIGNIRESYPISKILGALASVSVLLVIAGWWTQLPQRWWAAPHEGWRQRWRIGGAWFVTAIGGGLLLDSEQLPAFRNNYHRELAKNGTWSLFAAFRNNELEYDQFYPTLPIERAFAKLHEEFAAHEERVHGAPRDSLRFIHAPRSGPELHPNVIQITVESLSADFLSPFNRASRLTPNLEALAQRSLMFENFYATGTRTDRGMEALTLALPPTPGRSLIKRPNNEHLFTLGSVFRSRGYDTAFIYGGYGYFDNMSYFFGHNGYRVIDRASVAKNDITFANAWGACDEDLFRWTLREADNAHAAGKPFHFFVMTTSNHRPFTYPEGRIDLPSKVSGRAGAVKYTDYAIGWLLREAERHPWFKDTVFVIVADHCASVAGKTALPVQNYHIPLFIYSPGGQIAPGRVSQLMSQIDYAPTLLGLLNWSYASRFYGWNVLDARGDRRVLIGNYQRLGFYEPGILDVLKPIRQHDAYNYDPTTFALAPRSTDASDREEAIAYYQTASYLYRNRLYREISPSEQMRFSAQHGVTPSVVAAREDQLPSESRRDN